MYLLGLKYLEALPQLTAGKGTTIFLPAEASGVMGALGGLRELLTSTGRRDEGDDRGESRGTRSPGTRSAASSGLGLGYPSVPRIGDGSDDTSGTDKK